MLMCITCWIVLGLVVGAIANEVINGRGEGVGQDIALGIVGALIGGWLVHAVTAVDLMGFNFRSLFVAMVGAFVMLVSWHTIRGRVFRA